MARPNAVAELNTKDNSFIGPMKTNVQWSLRITANVDNYGYVYLIYYGSNRSGLTDATLTINSTT